MHPTRCTRLEPLPFLAGVKLRIDGHFNKATNVVETLLQYGLLSNSLFSFLLMNFPILDEDPMGAFTNKLSCIYSFYIRACLLQKIVLCTIFIYVHHVLWLYSSLLFPFLAFSLLFLLCSDSPICTFITCTYC